MLAAKSQLEEEMQEQRAQGGLLHGEQMAEFSRLEAQANAKTSRTKTALDTLATTQQARTCSACARAMLHLFTSCAHEHGPNMLALAGVEDAVQV